MHGKPASFYPRFDYLRILAAIGVFLSHALPETSLPPHFGLACVQLFFALSGFLIGTMLLSPDFSASRFYFNRAARIWIPYYIALGLVIIGTSAKQNIFDPKIWEFLFYKATFTYNIFGTEQTVNFASRMPLLGAATHFWSISVEEQFYLIAPALIILLPRSVVSIFLIVIVLANSAFPHFFSAISLGVLLALSRERFGDWTSLPPARLSFVLLGCLAAWSLATDCLSFNTAAPFVAISVVALAATQGPQHSFGRILGGSSYSFYLNHWIALYAIKPIVPLIGFPLATIVSLAGMILLSVAHYITIDSYIAANRAKWFSERRGAILCGIGVSLVTIGIVAVSMS